MLRGTYARWKSLVIYVQDARYSIIKFERTYSAAVIQMASLNPLMYQSFSWHIMHGLFRVRHVISLRNMICDGAFIITLFSGCPCIYIISLFNFLFVLRSVMENILLVSHLQELIQLAYMDSHRSYLRSHSWKVYTNYLRGEKVSFGL